jgi:hypothetical protein
MVQEVHPAFGELEAYAFGLSPEAILEDVEEHLRCCIQCQNELAMRNGAVKLGDKGRLRSIHITEDGPIFGTLHSRADGKWVARHWGRQLDGYGICDSTEEASRYLTKSFQQMFPEHVCTRQCSDYVMLQSMRR